VHESFANIIILIYLLYTHMHTDDGEDDALLPLNFRRKQSLSYQGWETVQDSSHANTVNGGCSRYTPPLMQGPETNKMHYTQPSCLITAPNTKGDC